METLVAIGICVVAAVVFLTPIIRSVIRVEKYDDSTWYTDHPEDELPPLEDEDEPTPTDKQ
jgi:hypothetical protein